MSAAELVIVSGGTPTDRELSALAAAATALVEAELAPAPDPVPPAYRSRWRRAALIETSEVPVHVKDDGPAWGGR